MADMRDLPWVILISAGVIGFLLLVDRIGLLR